MRERVSRCDAMRWSIQIKHDTKPMYQFPCVPRRQRKQPRYRLTLHTHAVVNKQRSPLLNPCCPLLARQASSLQLILARLRVTSQIGSDVSTSGRPLPPAAALGHKGRRAHAGERNATNLKDPIAPFELQSCRCLT
jgi:hypothetical protein